jgi:hypothetical protein
MTMSAPWERQKPSEYYTASDFEKLQWVAGLPARFWNTALSSIRPKGLKIKEDKEIVNISAALQTQYLAARIEQPGLMNANRLVVMTSSPTDEHALAAACMLATAAIRRAFDERTVSKIRVDDIQEYEKCLSLKREFYTIAPKLLVIHNLNPNTSRERLSLVRDLLNANEGVYRVVVAAAESPFEFAQKSLYMEPNEVYHFEGRPKKRLVI